MVGKRDMSPKDIEDIVKGSKSGDKLRVVFRRNSTHTEVGALGYIVQMCDPSNQELELSDLDLARFTYSHAKGTWVDGKTYVFTVRSSFNAVDFLCWTVPYRFIARVERLQS